MQNNHIIEEKSIRQSFESPQDDFSTIEAKILEKKVTLNEKLIYLSSALEFPFNEENIKSKETLTTLKRRITYLSILKRSEENTLIIEKINYAMNYLLDLYNTIKYINRGNKDELKAFIDIKRLNIERLLEESFHLKNITYLKSYKNYFEVISKIFNKDFNTEKFASLSKEITNYEEYNNLINSLYDKNTINYQSLNRILELLKTNLPKKIEKPLKEAIQKTIV